MYHISLGKVSLQNLWTLHDTKSLVDLSLKIEPANFPAKMQTIISIEGGHCQAYSGGNSEVQGLPNKFGEERTFPEIGERVIDFDLSESLLSYSTDVSRHLLIVPLPDQYSCYYLRMRSVFITTFCLL